MKNIQRSIAILSILTVSNQLLASGGGITPSNGSGRLPGGIISPPTTATSPIKTGTTRRCDRRNPATFIFCDPAPNHTSTFPSSKKPKKISGSFGTPQGELEKGNMKGAKLACIQQGIDGGQLPANTSDSSAWEYVSNGAGNKRFSLPASSSDPISYALESSAPDTPLAFRIDPCHQNTQRTACMQLLDKALTEEPQAYYQSEVDNPESKVWDEVIVFLGISLSEEPGETKDLNTALTDIAKNEGLIEDPDIRATLLGIAQEDPLLVATKLLVQKIDQALANGNAEVAAKGKALLAKINPSAAHAIECVLGYLPNQGLNVDANPFKPGPKSNVSRVGPLSGTDYGKMDELLTQGNSKASFIIAIIALGIQAADFIINRIHNASNKKDADRNEHDRLVDQADKYQKCSYSPEMCEKMFPEGATYTKELQEEIDKEKSEKEASAGTGGPERPLNRSEDAFQDDFNKPLSTDPCPGCGGAGGELLPPDELPQDSTTPFAEIEKQASWTATDPFAGERLCNEVVRDFKKYSIGKAASPSRPLFNDTFFDSRPIDSPRFSVTQFDKWTAKLWSDLKFDNIRNPENGSEKNNCNAMDEVEAI